MRNGDDNDEDDGDDEVHKRGRGLQELEEGAVCQNCWSRVPFSVAPPEIARPRSWSDAIG